MNTVRKDSGAFKPGKFSGWIFTYLFDEEAKLKKRINSFHHRVLAEYSYQRNKTGDRLIERETIEKDDNNCAGECIEQENFFDMNGMVVKVNFWAVDLKKNARELFLIEQNAEYKNGRLMSFTRQNVNENHEVDAGETCELFYDGDEHLIRIERKDMDANLKTVLNYSHNAKGFMDHYSVDFLIGLPIYGKNLKQDIYYKYDSHGNWIRKYRLSGGKKRVEAKRTIKYK